MVDDQILQKLASDHGIDKYSILREILQISFLNEFYANSGSRDIYFKGGTAIKILFNSPRFSEDLDFTTQIDPKEIVDKTVENLKKEYPEIYVKDIEALAGISKKIYLKTPISPNPLTIKLDFSQRESVLEPTKSTISTDLPIVPTNLISHLSKEEILAEKFRAITNRQKGRDLYDFLFLIDRKTEIKIDLIKEKLNFYDEIYEPKKFIERIKNWDEKELDNDLRRFLPLKDRGIIPEIKNLLISKLTDL